MQLSGRILLAMSGGTDSSVAGLLLCGSGRSVEGVTFISCDGNAGIVDAARQTAAKLNIPHTVCDVRELFEQVVISNFVSEYMAGRTPNPCVECNRHIKWARLWEEAKKRQCTLLATGHYARIGCENGRYFVRKGIDKNKDQSYFLWRLSQDDLSHTLFPLGSLTKPKVRQLALQHGFDTLAEQKESQEICFTGNDYRSFLRSRLPNIDEHAGTGNFVDNCGRILGQHKGYPFYTVGQRKGLVIALGHPAYVTNINAATNEITLGSYNDLLKKTITVTDVNYHKYAQLIDSQRFTCKIRYKGESYSCHVFNVLGGLRIEFEAAVAAAAPGQSAVLYENDDVVAGGIIANTD